MPRFIFVFGCLALAPVYAVLAQAPAGRGAAPAIQIQPRGASVAPVETPRVYADMLQMMRGVLYPQSNVIFTAQIADPASFKPALRPAISSDPYTSVFGNWQAFENAAVGLAESANLLLLPRTCSNGRPAPIQNADWKQFTQEVRDAGMAAYKVGRAKDADAILDVANMVSESCEHCHNKYRNVGGIANRCMP